MIRTDSRKVCKGDTFVALPGISSNGDQYISQAIEKGAARIICREGDFPVETIHTEDPRKYLEQLLQEQYGPVTEQMTLIAVTGTNGKTTTCYLIAQALNRLGRKCAYIGTIGFYMGEKIKDLPNTSVDICDLYELLLTAHEHGFDTVALEASSQGIDAGRLNTLAFDISVFTNLTEDHLDYHKTMEHYAACKRRIFHMRKPGAPALINADDPYRDYFLEGVDHALTYGIRQGDIRAEAYAFENGSTEFSCSMEEESFPVRTGMVGTYNIYNTLAVIGVLKILGFSSGNIRDALEDLGAPEGRCDVIPYRSGSIIIDYAHTPDAVQNILKTAKEFTKGRIYVVFGCTGDRERQKRPVMTQIVLKGCSYAVITNDDVHGEDEHRIVSDMLEGNTCTNYEICLDRKEAIQRAVDLMGPEDTLLILGKGHENFIVMNGYSIPHNDKKAVLEYIHGRNAADGV